MLGSLTRMEARWDCPGCGWSGISAPHVADAHVAMAHQTAVVVKMLLKDMMFPFNTSPALSLGLAK